MVYERSRRLSNARLLALELLDRVDTDRSYLNLLLPKFQLRLPTQDRGFLQELTYGTIRWQRQYDLLIDDLVSGRVLEPSVRNVLRLGAHQLFRMRVGQHAAVNETVELAKRRQPKVAGLVNAVMRKLSSADLEVDVSRLTKNMAQLDRLSYQHSIPAWIIGQFAAALKVSLDSSELERELQAVNQTPTVSLSAAQSNTRENLLKLGANPGRHSPLAVSVTGELSKFLSEPRVRVQDEGSQLIAQLVGNLADDRDVVDLCAGPGGKAALVQDLLPNNQLLCIEPVEARAKLVEAAVGPESARVVIADGTTYEPKSAIGVVLVDAPCSGLGSLRRKPESRWLKSESEISQLRMLQLKLLANAAKMLGNGGFIVYSTCTPVLAETVSVIAEFMESHKNFALQDATTLLSQIAPTLDLPTDRKTVQLWTGEHGTDDMFMAVLKKSEVAD